MSETEPRSSTDCSTTAVHPFELFKPEWTQSRQSVQMDSLIVQHDIQTPDTVEYFSLTHHMLAMMLTPGTHQVTHIGEQKYEGSFGISEFFLQPVTNPGFYSWSTTDEAIVFIIEPDFLTRTAAQTECLNPDKIELNPLALGRDPQIEYIARCFLAEMQNDALGGRLYSETLATQLAIHLLRNYCTFPAQLKQYEGGLSGKQLKAVIRYIDANLAASISLKDLARISGLNSNHYFCHLFKQSTGVSPYKYVIEQRIEKVKQLLKQDLPLIEIALECGFSDQSALSRTFRKCVGTTPRSYRRQL